MEVLGVGASVHIAACPKCIFWRLGLAAMVFGAPGTRARTAWASGVTWRTRMSSSFLSLPGTWRSGGVASGGKAGGGGHGKRGWRAWQEGEGMAREGGHGKRDRRGHAKGVGSGMSVRPLSARVIYVAAASASHEPSLPRHTPSPLGRGRWKLVRWCTRHLAKESSGQEACAFASAEWMLYGEIG